MTTESHSRAISGFRSVSIGFRALLHVRRYLRFFSLSSWFDFVWVSPSLRPSYCAAFWRIGFPVVFGPWDRTSRPCCLCYPCFCLYRWGFRWVALACFPWSCFGLYSTWNGDALDLKGLAEAINIVGDYLFFALVIYFSHLGIGL